MNAMLTQVLTYYCMIKSVNNQIFPIHTMSPYIIFNLLEPVYHTTGTMVSMKFDIGKPVKMKNFSNSTISQYTATKSFADATPPLC